MPQASPLPALNLLFLARLRALFGGGRAPYNKVDAKEAERLVREQGAVLVDVREGFEWRRGHAPGARHIPLGKVKAHLAELPRDRPVVLMCALGARSAMAARTLAENGFADVHNLEGGFRAWRKAGLPEQAEE